MNDVTPENAHFFNLKEATGAIVSQVTPDSPASRKAGMKQGDVITELNGSKIGQFERAAGCGERDDTGNEDPLGVMRNGKPVDAELDGGRVSREVGACLRRRQLGWAREMGEDGQAGPGGCRPDVGRAAAVQRAGFGYTAWWCKCAAGEPGGRCRACSRAT
jgi:hypothetical protein